MAKFIIPSIFTAEDKFSPAMKAMGKNVDAFAARAERKIRRVGNAAEKIGKTTLVAGLALAAPLIVATKAAVDFESQMSNVSTLLKATPKEMDKMGDEILSLSQKLPVPIEDLTASLYSIRSAGVSAEDAMGVLESASKLSVAGLSTVAEATDLTTSAVNAFAGQGLKAEEITNILMKTVKAGKTDVSQLATAFGAVAPAAVAAGVSLQEVSAATAALTLGGVPTSQAQNQLKALFNETTKTSGKLAEAYAKLGRGNIAAAVKSKGFMSVLQEVKKSVGGNEIAFKNLFSSQEASGAALTLAGSQNAAYTATLLDMEGGVDVLSEAFLKQMGTSKAQLQLMKNNTEALSITIGQQLLPVINSVIQKIIPLVKGFRDWARENPKLFKGIVIGVAVLSAFLLTVSALSFGVAAISKVMVAWGMITKTIVAVQWLLNAAMMANPIGLIILGIVALIAVVSVIIAKYNEWGAALSLFLGPLGIIINLIQSFRRNWDGITEAFREGGILAGFKMIGATILDSILMPLQQVFSLMTNLPGVGRFAQSAVDKIGELRTNIGVNTVTDESGNQTEMAKSAPLINTQAEKEENMRKMFAESRSRVDLNVNDKNGRTEVKSTSPDVFVKLTPTM